MPSYNKCVFIGNLGRDPEMRYTPTGKQVVDFSVAVNRNYKDGNGEWQQSTEWVNAVVFGDSAERAAEQLRKGSLVLVEGRQETQEWTDKETGKPARRVVHILSSWTNLTKKESDGEGRFSYVDHMANDPRHAGDFGGGAAAPAGGGGGYGNTPDLDDLPF